MRPGKRLKRNTVYLLVWLVQKFFDTVPRRLALFVGAWLGLVAHHLLPRDRYRIDRHLSLAFDDSLTPSEKREIARSFFVNTGKNLADICRFRNHFATEISPRVSIEGLDIFDTAYRRGRGLLCVTGHIGNFELLAAYFSGLGYKVGVVGRRLYDARLDQLLVSNREAMGIVNFATTSSPREVLRWLHAGHGLGVLIDTDSIRVRGAFVPFFGRLANTPIVPSLLALKAGAAILPVACLRTIDDGYRIIVRPEVKTVPSGDTDRDARLLTAACVRALEEIITDHKSQWIWLHNRWHTRPHQSA
ncbi:MAG: lysophospholipid acyltransferase family protein [bacterium]